MLRIYSCIFSIKVIIQNTTSRRNNDTCSPEFQVSLNLLNVGPVSAFRYLSIFIKCLSVGCFASTALPNYVTNLKSQQEVLCHVPGAACEFVFTRCWTCDCIEEPMYVFKIFDWKLFHFRSNSKM